MARHIEVFNAQLRSKQVFKPKVAGAVRLYVCGMTMYDICHVGHARVMVVFDMIVRTLRAFNYTVTYVRNITDIDDKILHKASIEQCDWQHIVERYIQTMHEDERALGVLAPDHEPRATAYIESMITMIQSLIERGHAYIADDQDVYFDIQSFQNYGQLAHQKLETLYTEVRKALSSAKRQGLDFILWKQAKPGEPSWPSPWGLGRPGWHIECSAMATQLLGHSIDLHGGGIDLKFPHHENEIAQSEGATGHPFVKYWIHVGHVLVNEEKMSKSLGNFTSVRDLLAQYHPEVIRYLLLSSHYRSPVSYSPPLITAAKRALIRLYTALDCVEAGGQVQAEACEPFYQAMSDDFNAPKALAVCFEFVSEIFSLKSTDMSAACTHAANLKHCLGFLGLGQSVPREILQGKEALDISTEEIDQQIALREKARLEQQWDIADRIRDQLAEQGVILEDTEGRTTWRRT
jgi:cysteinyl-tRNA synthetase